MVPGRGVSELRVQGARALGGALLLGLCWLLLPSVSRANPLDAYGLMPRAQALGSAYAAVADDTAAGYYNPAGLAQSEHLRIEVGYQGAVPRLDVNGVRQELLDTRGMTAGLLVPGKIYSVRFAFGLSLFLPDQHATRIRVLNIDQPRLHLFDNRSQRLYLSASLAVRVYKGLYVGAGLSFMSRSQGVARLRGTIALTDADTSALESAIDVSLLAIRYPQVGILWRATPQLSLGLVYRHRFQLDLEQGFEINADVGDPGREPVVKGAHLNEVAYSVDLFQPWQIVAAVAVHLPRLLLSFDLTYLRWSEQPPPAATFTLDLDVGRFNELVKLPKSTAYPNPGFRNTLMPAVGIEYRALEEAARGHLSLDLRAGYRYEASPVPEQDGDSSLGDADKHHFSIGLGLELVRLTKVLPRPFAIDGFFGFTYLPERQFKKLDPRSATGDFSVAGTLLQGGVALRLQL